MKSRNTSNVRRSAAILSAKMVGIASRALGRGAGTSLPGVVAEGIDPTVLSVLGQELQLGTILVTGTNGKTTTARMIAEIMTRRGYSVVRNRAGANMMRGLVTSLVEVASLRGEFKDPEETMGVFEVDEAFLPAAIKELRPTRVVLLNVFRDQLDRYGEVANIPAVWREPLRTLSEDAVVVANADDPLVAEVSLERVNTCWYGLETEEAGPVEHGGDVKTCPRCGGPISYSMRYYGHLGRYCSPCGFQRPTPALIGTDAHLHSLEGSDFEVRHGRDRVRIRLPLAGLFNVSNACAAAATSVSLGVPLQTAAGALESLTSAFGRMESFSYRGRSIHLLLGKNPTGYNQVLRAVFENAPKSRHVLFMLNDNPADGRDVSWIWDVDFERARDKLASVSCSGLRGGDMALRLKYAGLDPSLDLLANTFDRTEAAFDNALSMLPEGDELYIFATYSAMLEMRRLLTRRKIAPPYWER